MEYVYLSTGTIRMYPIPYEPPEDQAFFGEYIGLIDRHNIRVMLSTRAYSSHLPVPRRHLIRQPGAAKRLDAPVHPVLRAKLWTRPWRETSLS
jgi:hypothetical protein